MRKEEETDMDPEDFNVLGFTMPLTNMHLWQVTVCFLCDSLISQKNTEKIETFPAFHIGI